MRTTSLTGLVGLPKTGQTVSYSGGDDGDLQKGVVGPSPRFNDNGDQTITDNLTGLIWTQDSNTPGPVACSPGANKTWQGAFDYVDCLNTNNYLGHNDWRLPNINEIESLVNYGQPNSSVWLTAQGFSNIQSSRWHWSSTTFASSTTYAHIIMPTSGNLYTGPNVGYGTKSLSYTVWPVCAGQ